VIANRYQPLEPPKEIRGDKPSGLSIRARDLQTAQTVVLRSVTALDPRLVGIFHPALITIFDLVHDGAARLAACEFVPSRSLRIVMGGQPFNARRAAEIVSEDADGVAELHGRGLAHGAISVDSVVLTTKGKAKLDLLAAVDATEGADVRLLQALMSDLTGREHPELASATSAAVLAAHLRSWQVGTNL
jgi:serine/threonine protein kinase